MKHSSIFLLVILWCAPTFAADKTHELAARMIKGGEIVKEYRIVFVKTPKGSEVELRFSKEGEFLKAEGEDIPQDDVHIGVLGIGLQEALKICRISGLQPDEWDLLREDGKWIYRFIKDDGSGQNRKIDALSGKLL